MILDSVMSLNEKGRSGEGTDLGLRQCDARREGFIGHAEHHDEWLAGSHLLHDLSTAAICLFELYLFLSVLAK